MMFKKLELMTWLKNSGYVENGGEKALAEDLIRDGWVKFEVKKTSQSDDTTDKINMILDWAEDHPTFDTEFVENIQSQFEDSGSISDAQDQALDNIIERWKIE